MRARATPVALAAALSIASGAWARSAAAESLDEGVPFKSVALQGEPLAVIIGRFSADLEYLPDAHHALHLSPHTYYAFPGKDDELDGFGAEVGYRFYTGAHGPHGLFMGASFLFGQYHYVHVSTYGPPLDPPDDTHYYSFGGALDVGWQSIVLGNFAVGAGAGVQYTSFTTQPTFEYVHHPWHDFVYGSGLRPRVLLALGAAF
jgi:hypothetical protein